MHILNKSVSIFVSVIFVFLTAFGVGQPARAAGTLCVDPANTPTCFATIQEAVNAAVTGDVINVAAGTYVEDLLIDKSLTLLGPNSAVNPNTGTRVGEAILLPATSLPNPNASCTVMAYITTSDVTIKGFKFDGDNPALTSGITIGSADVDACELIASSEGVGGIVIENNILKNATYSGLDFYNYTNDAATSNNYFRYNLISDIGETTYNWGLGVLIYNNFYVDITDNVFENVRVGIQTGNYYRANVGPTGSISNNTISAWRLGIFNNLWYSSASTISLSNNTINAISSSGSTKWNGILLSSFQGSVNANLSNNIINIGTITQNPSAGYNIWNTPTTAALTISGGTVAGGNYGVWVNNFEGYNSNADNTSIKIDGITINNASTAGVFVSDSASNTNGSTVYANIQNSTITNSVTGILVSGSDASAKANFNKITGNATKGINNTSGTLMDGEKNWWGNITGPSSVGTGSGDSVSTDVDYTPWCGNAACSFFVPPFPLVVTANNQTIIVGQSDPIFTFSYDGLVNGDNSTVIDVAPICSVSGPHSLPGSYPIVCSGGSDANYIFSDYIDGMLTVNAANNAPLDISLTGNTVNQNQPVGTLVGTFISIDPDAGDTFTYSLISGVGSTDNASFSILGNQLRTAAVFNFAVKSSYSIRVRSTDSGSLFFDKVFMITVNSPAPATSLVNSVLPTSRSVQIGTTATVFNTIINAGENPAIGITLSMNPAPAGTFVYQQTNCNTNAVMGSPNPSLDLAPGGILCYVLSFTPSAAFSATNVHIQALASNALSTNLLTGINTWLLRSTVVAGPDVIALTTTTDFHQIACSGADAFAVALSNIGVAATGDITVSANTGSTSLPISVFINETNPGTGAIIGDNILQSVGAGDNRTVAVFVTYNGCINFDPAVSRIFIEFRDENNNVVGSTSTAISTSR